MSDMFSENFRSLRKKHGFTQEKVAELLGVTAQAVSKWETATSYPDISVLPIISKLFGVSVDHLLGINISERNTEIAEALKTAESLNDRGESMNAVSVLRSALLQYPANVELMYGLAWCLTGTIREYPENLWESINIYEKILEFSDDTEMRAKVIRDLMYRYYTAGDRETALKWAKMLPSFDVCREYNFGRSNLLDGRELAEYLMGNLQLYGAAMRECLEYFADNAILTDDDMRPYTTKIAKEKIRLLDQMNAV